MNFLQQVFTMSGLVTLSILLSTSQGLVSSVLGVTATSFPDYIHDSGVPEGPFSPSSSEATVDTNAKTLSRMMTEAAAHIRNGSGVGTLLSEAFSAGRGHNLPGAVDSPNWDELINMTKAFQHDEDATRSGESTGGATPLEELSRTLLRETGGDNGLLDVIDELQSGADGSANIEDLAQTFSRLSDSLKSRGTSIDTLMDAFLNTPLARTDPLEIPEDIKVLYRKSKMSRGNSTNDDIVHIQPQRTNARNVVDPPFVDSSVIKNHMEMLHLPSPIKNARCYALILAGGSATAPLQAGAILGLAEQYKANKMPLKWDVIAAVNKAAISAAAGTLFGPGWNGELDFARFLWNHWQQPQMSDFIHCPNGLKDLMNLPRILKWVVHSEKEIKKGRASPTSVGVPHDCSFEPLKEYLERFVKQHPSFIGGNERRKRIAVITATKVGGGKRSWEIESLGSSDICLLPMLSLADIFSETCTPDDRHHPSLLTNTGEDLVTRILLATNATPGLMPPVTVPMLNKSEAFADGSLSANIGAVEAIRSCQRRIQSEGMQNLTEVDLKNGKGIVIDIIGVSPFETPNVDDQLLDVVSRLGIIRSKKQVSLESKGSAKQVIARVRQIYPDLHFRHAIFPEEVIELMNDNLDFRSAEPMLHRGRLLGWKATTVENFY